MGEMERRGGEEGGEMEGKRGGERERGEGERLGERGVERREKELRSRSLR